MKSLTFVSVLLLIATGALATGASQNTSYIAGPEVGQGIWCDEGGHNYTPVGDPSDYGDTSKTAPPLELLRAHAAWASSGQPECIATDLAFGTQDDSAVGKVAICVAGRYNGRDCGEHRGHDLLVYSNDILGMPHIRIVAETCAEHQPDCDTLTASDRVSAEGCGAVAMTIPHDLARFWRTPTGEPAYFVWVYVHNVYLDRSSGNLCLGSSGTLTADY